MTSKRILLLLLIQAIILIGSTTGQCLNPKVSSSDSTVAPPEVDTTETRFVVNPDTTNTKSSGALQLRMTWDNIANRELVFAGIGDDLKGCAPYVSVNGLPSIPDSLSSWSLDGQRADCRVELIAKYEWPHTYDSPNCKPFLQITQPDSNTEKVTFDFIVKFNETRNVTRDDTVYTLYKTIFYKLPISMFFPKTASVDSNGVANNTAIATSAPQPIVNCPGVTASPMANGLQQILAGGQSFVLIPLSAWNMSVAPRFGNTSSPSSNSSSNSGWFSWEFVFRSENLSTNEDNRITFVVFCVCAALTLISFIFVFGCCCFCGLYHVDVKIKRRKDVKDELMVNHHHHHDGTVFSDIKSV